MIIVAFGLTSRTCKKVVDIAREENIKVGLLRPITLWPFPIEKIKEFACKDSIKFLMSVEMNAGQMVEDVRLAVNGKKPVHFYGRMGGIIPTPNEIFDALKKEIK